MFQVNSMERTRTEKAKKEIVSEKKKKISFLSPIKPRKETINKTRKNSILQIVWHTGSSKNSTILVFLVLIKRFLDQALSKKISYDCEFIIQSLFISTQLNWSKSARK